MQPVIPETLEAPASRGGGASAAPPRRTLLDIFSTTVLCWPDRPAIDAADSELTYAELSDRASALADRLRAFGVGPGDRVGVRVASGTAELYVAILGILSAGAAYVPVDAGDPSGRATDLFQRAGACAVVRDGLAIERLAPASGVDRAPAPDDDAWVIFTSGSTGAPKGVAVAHRSAAAFVDAEADLIEIAPADRVLAGLSVSFDASCEEMWLAWRHGATLVPASRAIVRGGTELSSWLTDCEITVLSTVPSLAAMWDQASLQGVRLLILGGEACPESLGWRLSADREVWNTYGPTEATVVTTAARIEPGEPVTIGWPLAGWQIAVVGENGDVVSPGEPGELVISGVGLARYLDPALDAERFAGMPSLGWERAYRTGDVVRATVDGLRFIGRRDDQVKLAGRRIELAEVDAYLNAAPGIRAAAAAVRESAAGNKLLVGYVVGDVDTAAVRASVAERLPIGVTPLIVPLDSLPRGVSGKVDRNALPWPPPATAGAATGTGGGTTAWLAERWTEQLGPLPITADSDFFELGGTSLATAKLVSALRSRFPAVAIADVYNHRRLGQLSARLDQLGAVQAAATRIRTRRRRGWALLQLGGVFALQVLLSPQWLLAVLTLNRVVGRQIGPQLGWGWLLAGWLVFGSIPGRALMLSLARRVLLRRMAPGRYARHSSLTLRIWLLERLAAAWRLQGLEGTPWAARYARLCGHPVGRGARLFTLPPAASLVTIGEDATIETGVDLEGWWIDGQELVVGELRVGPRARIGALSVLMPGAAIDADAEIEPGSVVSEFVPAGQRWAGSPARRVGEAGESWPSGVAPRPPRARLWKAMYAVGMAAHNLLPLAAAAPGLLALLAFAPPRWTVQGVVMVAITIAPLLVLSFMISYGLLVALVVRAVSPLLRPGWHPEGGAASWAVWLTGSLMDATNDVLFPLYASVYTRFWLKLLGVRVGRRAEVSVVTGLNGLATLADTSFAADAAVFACARSRFGWLHLGRIDVGHTSFLGNGAIVEGWTRVGDESLVGVLTTAPHEIDDGTSWFGSPALELPRRPDAADPTRTTNPSWPLVLARGATELLRMLLASSISVVLASLMLWALEWIGASLGIWAMAAATPLAFVALGVCAALITIALKWLLMGRYRRGEHPLWSFFVWRDEIMNTCQEQLAGPWLIGSALGTPLMSVYLRLMGSKVGREVWCETMTITEFDMVTLGDGCVVNRHAIVQTHLFHDRLLRIGPASLGPRSTLGPISAMLPDSSIGDGCSVGARSVVMRGEQLPAGTRWHGAPVVAA